MQRIERMLMLGILIAGIGGTALFVPGVIFPYVFGKVLWLILGSTVILGTLAYALYQGFDRFHLSRVTLGAFLLFGVQIVWLLFSSDRMHTLWGSDARGVGIATSFMIAVVLLGLDALSSPIRLKAIKTITLSALIPLVIAFGSVLMQGLHRVEGTLGNSILMGNYLLFVSFLGLVWTQSTKGKERTWWIGFTGLSVLGLFLTETRGAMLGLLVAAVSMASLYAYKGSKKLRLFVGGGMIGLMVLGGSALIMRDAAWVSYIPGLHRLTHIGTSTESDAQRPLIWKTALEGVKERPLLGFGGEHFERAFDQYFDARLTRYGFSQTWSDRAHNIFLDWLVMYGILGTLMIIMILGYTVLPLLKGNYRILTIGITIAYSVQALVEFDGPANLMCIALLGSILSTLTQTNEEKTVKVGKYVSIPLVICGLFLLVSGVRSYQTSRAVADFVAGGGTLLAWHDTHMMEVLTAQSPYRTDGVLRVANTIFENTRDISSIPMIEDAIRLIEQEESTAPERLSLKVVKANLYLRKAMIARDTNSYMMADTILNAAQRLSPHRQSLLAQRANIAALQGNITEAVALQKQAVDLDPTIGLITFRYHYLNLGLEPKDTHLTAMFSYITEHDDYLPTATDELSTLISLAISKENYEVIGLLSAQKVFLSLDVEASRYNASIALATLKDEAIIKRINALLAKKHD